MKQDKQQLIPNHNRSVAASVGSHLRNPTFGLLSPTLQKKLKDGEHMNQVAPIQRMLAVGHGAAGAGGSGDGGGRKPIKNPIPGPLEHYESSMVTTCVLTIYSADGSRLISSNEFVSGDGLHAEERAIAYLTTLVNNGTLPSVRGVGDDYIVHFSVSKSPCSSTSDPRTRTDGKDGCAELLTHLRDNGIRNRHGHIIRFSVQIAATKPYQPSKKGKGVKAASIDTMRRFDEDNSGDGSGSGAYPFVRK
ncbi:hypothetical protein [Ekhidna sp.]|uniref:hypothetical protein n=1 Tax=Ekhidna sp. TaxID=2608089 RepID=UPI00329A7E26